MLSTRTISLLLVAVSPLSVSADPWPRHTIDASSRGADGVRLADVNNDGLMDIAVGWEEGNVVRGYLHPGRRREREQWPAVTVGKVKSPEDAVFADLDEDGAVDVISCCEGRTRSVFVHWAPRDAADDISGGRTCPDGKLPGASRPPVGRTRGGQNHPRPVYLASREWQTVAFPATQQQQLWMYALPMQLDGRHGIDLVIGSKGQDGSVGWLQAPDNARDLNAWTWHKLQDAGWIMSLIEADMDGDGDSDVLVSDRKGDKRGVYWLEYPGAEAVQGNATWPRHDIGGADRQILFLSRGDLDQDGRKDVVAIDRKAIIWFRADEKTWNEVLIPLPDGVGTGKSAAVGDIDGDGRNDVVFGCEHANGELSGMRWLSWETSPTAGSWTSHEIGGPRGIKYDRVVLHDVDGDGDLDVLCCEERDQLGVFWYENPFGGTRQR